MYNVLIFILFNEYNFYFFYFFYILCNKCIKVNLYKLHFLSSHFSLKSNKRLFHSYTFPPLQPNTYEGKLNLFYPSTFPSFHQFSILSLFRSSNQTNLAMITPWKVMRWPSLVVVLSWIGTLENSTFIFLNKNFHMCVRYYPFFLKKQT